MSEKIKVLPFDVAGRKFDIQVTVSDEGTVTARAFYRDTLVSPVFTGLPSEFSADGGESIGFSVEDETVSRVEGWLLSVYGGSV